MELNKLPEFIDINHLQNYLYLGWFYAIILIILIIISSKKIVFSAFKIFKK